MAERPRVWLCVSDYSLYNTPYVRTYFLVVNVAALSAAAIDVIGAVRMQNRKITWRNLRTYILSL